MYLSIVIKSILIFTHLYNIGNASCGNDTKNYYLFQLWNMSVISKIFYYY